MRKCVLACVIAAQLSAVDVAVAQIVPPRPTPALESILHAFDTHAVVLLGESHWSVAQHRFLQQLIADPRLPEIVDDIAVEFGNARYQPLLDRYIAGEAVSLDSLRPLWQNAIVPMAWDVALYADFFRAVRAINQQRPRGRRLRVLALDPPISWDSVRVTEDIPRRWGARDPVWFEILDREVLTQHRKVLVVAGAIHILRRDPSQTFQAAPLDRAGLGDALAQRYPGVVFSVYPLLGTLGALARAQPWAQNMMYQMRGTRVGALSSHLLLPGNVTIFRMVNGHRVPRTLEATDYPPIADLIDAIVYYGPDTTLAPIDLAPYRNSRYVLELHRRSRIVQPMFGQDLDAAIDSLAHQACRQSARAGKRPCG